MPWKMTCMVNADKKMDSQEFLNQGFSALQKQKNLYS